MLLHNIPYVLFYPYHITSENNDFILNLDKETFLEKNKKM